MSARFAFLSGENISGSQFPEDYQIGVGFAPINIDVSIPPDSFGYIDVVYRQTLHEITRDEHSDRIPMPPDGLAPLRDWIQAARPGDVLRLLKNVILIRLQDNPRVERLNVSVETRTIAAFKSDVSGGLAIEVAKKPKKEKPRGKAKRK